MKFRDPKTGELFEDIDRAYSKYCCGRDCDTDCTLNVFKECGNWATNHPAEAARLMGLEVVEDAVTGVTQGGKSLFCEHIGVAPSQPFIVHGYPYRNYPPMVYGEDGCVRLYAPDGQKRHKVGGRAIAWIVDHPESVEPCEGYTPQEVAFQKEEPMEKKEKSRTCKNCGNNETKAGCGSCTCSKDDPNNPSGWKPVRPRICEVLGVEVGEEFSIDGYPTDYGVVQVCEDGKIRRVVSTQEFPFAEKGEVGHKIGNNALYYLIEHKDEIIRKPRLTPDEVAKAAHLHGAWGENARLRRTSSNTLVLEQGERLWLLPKEWFPSLRPGQSVSLEEIIDGKL